MLDPLVNDSASKDRQMMKGGAFAFLISHEAMDH